MTTMQAAPPETDEDMVMRTNPGASTGSQAYDERGRTIAWMTRTIHRLYNANAQRVLDRENVTIAHWYYLRILSQRGPLNQLELSRRVGIASTTAVTALDSLEKRGLVRRSRDTSDRRKYFVSLTDEGQRLIDALMPDIEEMLLASVRGIPADQMRTFWKVMHQITGNLSDAAGSEAVLD